MDRVSFARAGRVSRGYTRRSAWRRTSAWFFLEDADELGNHAELLVLVFRTQLHRLELRVERREADRDVAPLGVIPPAGGLFLAGVNLHRVLRAGIGGA